MHLGRTSARRVAVVTATVAATVISTNIAAVPAAVTADAGADDPRTNVIMLIGDGMGFNHVDAANLWEHGLSSYQSQEVTPALATSGAPAVPVQEYQSFDQQLAMDTGYVFSPPYAEIDAWASPRHATRESPAGEVNVTDSAAAATALSTGVRTRGGYLGIDRDEEDLVDMVDVASRAGLSTGVITSGRFWADTPAGFAVHTDDDDTDGIVSQLLGHADLDVVMGGGHPEFTNDGKAKDPYHKYVPQEQWQALKSGAAAPGLSDWALVEERADFQALAEGETPARVLGIPQTDGALTHDRPGDRSEPFGTPIAENVARLDELAGAGLNVLSNASQEGFFAVIEEANTDSAGHAGELGRTIENVSTFNRTVETVIDWVESESSWEETTVVVTADHETGNLWGAGTDESGKFQPLTGSEGELPEAEFTDFTDGEPGDTNPHYHTLQLVPFFAKGPAADALAARATGDDPARGDYLQNTDVAEVLHEHIRSSTAPPVVTSRTRLKLNRAKHPFGIRARARIVVSADSGQSTPTGAVTVRVAGRSIRATLSGGRATVRLPAGLRPRAHRVVANYHGDDGTKPSRAVSTVRIVKAKPRVRLQAPKRIRSGRPARFRVRVVVPNAPQARFRGRVVVRNGARILGAARVRTKSGWVRIVVPKAMTRKLARGRHVVRATARPTALTRFSRSAPARVRVRR